MSTTPGRLHDNHNHKIWIDLDNSPHVPFFLPIIEELKGRGYDLILTCRDNAQVLQLLDYNNLKVKHYGRHYGRHKLIKIVGIGVRALQLAPAILREKPDLALSHGSRSQIVLSSLLRIPSIAITDYEHAKLRMAGIGPDWLMVPEVISDTVTQVKPDRLLKYPGIKEDVYVPRFQPIPGIRRDLGLSQNDLVVTIRPPASDAHYHSPESDELFRAIVEYLSRVEDVRIVLLPRNKNQAVALHRMWPSLFATGTIRVPENIVNGLNLMWFSDFVISAGGTMNREAAALGVPVYSIFKGKSASVDRYLAATGRLVLLLRAEDVKNIRLVRRDPPSTPSFSKQPALAHIVQNVSDILEFGSAIPGYRAQSV